MKKRWIAYGIVAIIGINILGGVLGWFAEGVQVAKEEFGPRAMLTKYEWFKNTGTRLDAMSNGVKVLELRSISMYSDYDGIPRHKWDRTDKQTLSLWQQEAAGAKMAYNNLASEWNAQISKFNWKPFVGDLPIGAERVLSSTYAPYIIM